MKSVGFAFAGLLLGSSLVYGEGDCGPAMRPEYTGHCAQRVDCYEQALRRLEQEVAGELKGRERSMVMVRRSLEAHEEYRKAFCSGLGQFGKEMWNAFESKRREAPRRLSADEAHQQALMVAMCNVTLLGEFLYQFKKQYCSTE